MLPFFARTLTRREMALGCAVLSLALLLSTLPAALRGGQAQLDTGALLCADTLRFHIRADSDSPADQTAKLSRAVMPLLKFWQIYQRLQDSLATRTLDEFASDVIELPGYKAMLDADAAKEHEDAAARLQN